MGNWNINIQGIGCHHNGDTNEFDANRMAHQFVEHLREHHTIESATFTHGGKDDILAALLNPPTPKDCTHPSNATVTG